MFERLSKRIVCPAPPRTSVVVEQRTATLAGLPIPYTLKRSSKRRSIALRIDDSGLTVSMPLRAPEHWLNEVLQDRARWVIEKLNGWQARKQDAVIWADGEFIPYLGEQLTLRVTQGLQNIPAYQHENELLILVRKDISEAGIERGVIAWYKQQAIALFTSRVAHYADLLGVTPSEIKLTTAKKQWGSCSTRGIVRLNLQLIKLPLRLIDYVVVHELAHLREMNHSPAFWRVVESACPNYAKLRRELKSIGL